MNPAASTWNFAAVNDGSWLLRDRLEQAQRHAEVLDEQADRALRLEIRV